MVRLTIDGIVRDARPEERLVDAIARIGTEIPHVCYHPQLGPIQTCDTCMVEVDGQLVRACATVVADGMTVSTASAAAHGGAGRGVRPHPRATTSSTARCATTTTATAPSTTRRSCSRSSTSRFRSSPSRTRSTTPIRSTATIPTSASSAAAASRPARTSRSTRRCPSTGRTRTRACCGTAARRSRSRAACRAATASRSAPCNALMEKSMLGHAGFFTSLKKSTLKGMIDVVKGVEPETGYGTDPAASRRRKQAMREHRIRRTKTVCTYCGVGCSFDVWTKDRHILKVAPEHGPANGISTCVKGKFGWDFVNSPDRLTTPLIREGDDVPPGQLGRGAGARRPPAVGDQGRERARRARVHLLLEVHERGELPDAEAVARGRRHQQHRQLLALLPGAGDDGAVPHGRLRRRLGIDRRHRAGRPRDHHRQQHRREPSGARDARQERAQAATARS